MLFFQKVNVKVVSTVNLLPLLVYFMCHVEAEQDLSRLKKKNGLPGAKDHFKCVSISYNDVFLRENELHLGIFEKKSISFVYGER